MPYRIFISHTAGDKLIAEEITRVINNAFEGDIELYLAFREICGGDEWKECIKKNLLLCDALICLVTPEYVHRPWLFIEWSAFWLADKRFYILLTDDIKLSDLVHPMQDRQVTYMLDESSVRMFFRSLSADSKHLEVPYSSVSIFIEAVQDSIHLRDKEKMEKSYNKFKNKPETLPSNDLEKRAIAEYFYEIHDNDMYHQVAAKIRDDAIKSAMVIHLINLGDLTEAANLTEKIVSADKLVEISFCLIDLRHHDSTQVREIIENIALKNQSELRKIAIYLINRGESDCKLFEFVIENLTNMAEMRKIASYLIVNGHQKTSLFASLLETMRLNNQRETEKVLVELFDKDKELFKEILSKNLITNENVLKRLNQLSEN